MAKTSEDDDTWYEHDNYDAVTIRHITVKVSKKSLKRPFGFNKTAVRKKKKPKRK